MEKFCTSATIVTLHLFKQAIWEHMWKHTIEEMTNMQIMLSGKFLFFSDSAGRQFTKYEIHQFCEKNLVSFRISLEFLNKSIE